MGADDHEGRRRLGFGRFHGFTCLARATHPTLTAQGLGRLHQHRPRGQFAPTAIFEGVDHAVEDFLRHGRELLPVRGLVLGDAQIGQGWFAVVVGDDYGTALQAILGLTRSISMRNSPARRSARSRISTAMFCSSTFLASRAISWKSSKLRRISLASSDGVGLLEGIVSHQHGAAHRLLFGQRHAGAMMVWASTGGNFRRGMRAQSR